MSCTATQMMLNCTAHVRATRVRRVYDAMSGALVFTRLMHTVVAKVGRKRKRRGGWCPSPISPGKRRRIVVPGPDAQACRSRLFDCLKKPMGRHTHEGGTVIGPPGSLRERWCRAPDTPRTPEVCLRLHSVDIARGYTLSDQMRRPSLSTWWLGATNDCTNRRPVDFDLQLELTRTV